MFILDICKNIENEESIKAKILKSSILFTKIIIFS